jgi:hypothetical protein
VYEFPRPNPHIASIGKTVETHLKMGLPVVIETLRRGFEKIETIEFL